jgi:hypothetical protein
VRNDAGEPVGGVEVEAPYVPGLDCSVTTGDDGAFELRDLTIGENEITVQKREWPQQERTFSFASGEHLTWDVLLTKSLRVCGVLVDARGEPLVGWWLQRPGANRSAKTDGDGRFVVAGCEATGNELIVRKVMGFTPEVLRIRDVAPSEQEQRFVVPDAASPSAWFRGTCVAPDGSPLAEMVIDCVQQHWPVTLENELMRGNADGTFDLGPFPPGRYTFTPRHQRFVFAPLALDLLPHTPHDAGVLRGAEPARLVVELTGDVAQRAAVRVRLVGDGGRHTGSDDGDQRTFARIYPGSYRLLVRVGDEGEERVAAEVRLASGDDVVRSVSVR